MGSEHTHLEWKRLIGKQLVQHKYPSKLLKQELIDIVKDSNDMKIQDRNNGDGKANRYNYKENIKYKSKWKNDPLAFASNDQLLIDFETDILREGRRLVQLVHDCKEEELNSIESIDCKLELFDDYYELHNNFTKYVAIASLKYIKNKNAYYFSRLLLVNLNVLVIFHIKNNVQFGKEYSLNQYRFPQFINPLFNFLLLSSKQEVENIAMMKAYIEKFDKKQQGEMNELKAQKSTFNHMSFMNAYKFDKLHCYPNKSFDIAFGEKNEKMKTWINSIDELYMKEKKEKEKEIIKAKKQHQQLQNQIKKLQGGQKCECCEEPADEEDETGEMRKITCKRCKDIERKRKRADNLNIRILEKILPDCPNSRFAIAFEIWMPDIFIMLRNVVLRIEKLMYEQRYVQHRNATRQWRVLLLRRLGRDSINQGKVSCDNNLYSTKLWAMCCYGSKQHCTKTEDTFFVDCRCDVRCYAFLSSTNKCLLPDITSYQLTELDLSKYSENDITSYKSMQEFLSKSDELTHNDVLCKQDICPSDITLNNFISFALMKRNSNLVLNRILLDITQKKLKWNSQQNVLLILQALWQGLPDSGNNSTEFVNNNQFCKVLLREIETYLDMIKENWEQHYTLLCLIFLLRRFIDFSHFSYENASKLLIKSRDICIKWISQVEDELSAAQANTIDAAEKSIENLRKLLVLLNIIQSLTFFHFNSELQRLNSKMVENGLLRWIICMNNIYENYKCVKGDYFVENLLAIAKLHKSILVDRVILKYMNQAKDSVLNNFLRHKWKQKRNNYTFEYVPKSSQFVCHNNDDCVTLQIDIESGMFLINGTSVSRLPPKILENSDFQHLFPGVILEVNPLPKSNRYQTKYTFKGYYFIFEYVENNRVVITQFRQNDENGFDEYIYISKQHIKGLKHVNLPSMMVTSHWHWLDVRNNCIQFRNKDDAFDPLSKESIVYIWDEKLNVIKRSNDGYFLINTNGSYTDLIDFFKRLEEPQHIYIWQQLPKNGSNKKKIRNDLYHIYCELPRFNLTFELKSNKVLHCKEYNMTVDTDQGLNTLVGLQSKLVLEYREKLQHARRVVIVPYGDIECTKTKTDGDHHKTIVRQSNNDQETRVCHAFEVDSTLKCLRATDTIESWCYLALLHARTSYVLCDDFTKMTGVESSVHWLKNQCMPFGTKFNLKAMSILDSIASISPYRRYKDEEIDLPVQKVSYNDTMSEYAQFDGYLLLVSSIEPIVQPDLDKMEHPAYKFRKHNADLARMEYMRNSELYSNICINSGIVDEGWKQSAQSNVKNKILALKFEPVNVVQTNFALGRLCNDMTDLELDNFVFCDVNDWDEIDVLKEWCALYRIAQTGDKNCHQRLKMFISYKLFENGTKLDEEHITQRRNLLWRLIYICDNWQKFNNIKIVLPDDVNKWTDWFEDICFNYSKINQFVSMIDGIRRPESDAELVEHEEMLSRIRQEFVPLRKYFDAQNLTAIKEYKCEDASIHKIIKPYIKKIERIFYNKQLFEHFEMVNQQFGLNRIKCVSYTPVSQICINDDVTTSVDRYCLSDHASVEDKFLVSLGLSVRYHELMKIDDIQSLLFVQKELSVSSKLDPKYRNLAIELFTHRHGSIEHDDNGWKIEDYPVWLAFEIVTGMEIRKKQCQLAMHLLQSEKKEQEQIVTQLNMGEGKTSVILPIMALYLSNGIDRLSRIIVLRSLFPTNLSTLHSLFGILGRCVLSLPCNRASKLNANKISQLLDATLKNKGTIVATSDEIMSFNLRIRANSNFNNGDLSKCQDWIDKHVQNIMDEADEILHPRNQLIYPTGTPFIIDGKNVRWQTCMAVLEATYEIIDRIHYKYGERHIRCRASGGGAAPYIRFITDACYQELCNHIIEYIISGQCRFSGIEFAQNWRKEKQKKLKKLIESPSRITNNANFHEVKSSSDGELGWRGDNEVQPRENQKFFDSLSEHCQFLVLTLRGVLHHGCLLSVLKKRFNIDYGLPDNKRRVAKNRTEMAVPYRAKNVPSECSEFSHCDVAILMTLLSYYYNGLSEAQMHNLFCSSKIDQYYPSWMKKLKHDKGDMSEIAKLPDTWDGVNLHDEKVKRAISQALYNFVPAINFYVDHMVFPHYCKQFEYKLSNSPWNLAQKHENHITTEMDCKVYIQFQFDKMI